MWAYSAAYHPTYLTSTTRELSVSESGSDKQIGMYRVPLDVFVWFIDRDETFHAFQGPEALAL